MGDLCMTLCTMQKDDFEYSIYANYINGNTNRAREQADFGFSFVPVRLLTRAVS
jgi:hypothetical protein